MAEIRRILIALGLAQYIDVFEAQGYDDLYFVRDCAVDDLMQDCEMKLGHAKKLARHLAEDIPQSSSKAGVSSEDDAATADEREQGVHGFDIFTGNVYLDTVCSAHSNLCVPCLSDAAQKALDNRELRDGRFRHKTSADALHAIIVTLEIWIRTRAILPSRISHWGS